VWPEPIGKTEKFGTFNSLMSAKAFEKEYRVIRHIIFNWNGYVDKMIRNGKVFMDPKMDMSN
jgi:hypothetical protein